MRRALPILLLVAGCGDELSPFSLAFPVQERDKIDWLIGVDHDPEVQEPGLAAGVCTNYRGRAFPDCYDEHLGSDFALAGGFETMDSGSAHVLAAAEGLVIATHDGEYDRCHLNTEIADIDCDGFPMIANSVTVEHEDGIVTSYLHLKSGTVQVRVGDQVLCGEPLGMVGSSGYSSFPHLHFELQQDGEVIDPYAGKYSQPESWWTEQHPEGEQWPSSRCR
jgi:murein DD-endopeptidase MepM/ murein hydrolase activator NlpD